MNNAEKYDHELQLLEENLDWLVESQGLSEEAESHYRAYINHCKETTGLDLSNEGWDLVFNRRAGASSIRGTNSEMCFEALCYIANMPIEERVTAKERQIYGEDFVVLARKVSVKTRKHYPAMVESQPDTNVYLYREDFRPATWRVDILALVDPDTRTVTTLGYPALARMHCNVDSRGFCTPTFSGDKIMLSLFEYSQRRGSHVNTRNLAVDLKEKQAEAAQ
jgi:hypothetical protein